MEKPSDDEESNTAREAILTSNPVSTLKEAQGGRGYWPPESSCYDPKYKSTVWQLMLLGELGVPRTPWIESAFERFMTQHQMDNGAFCCPTVGGPDKLDEEPCLTGNMLRTLLVFGYGEDERVKKAIGWLPERQFEDGGWNCDFPYRKTNHSSFMSTIEPLWAYSEIPRSKWTRRLKTSAENAAEFLLAHRVYKSHRSGRPVVLRDMSKVYPGNPLTQFHFPMYYYYDVLHALRVLTKLGYQDDERIRDALKLVRSKENQNGRWLLDGDWARERRTRDRKTLVTLERLHEPSKWITLNCYRVLLKTGGLEVPSMN